MTPKNKTFHSPLSASPLGLFLKFAPKIRMQKSFEKWVLPLEPPTTAQGYLIFHVHKALETPTNLKPIFFHWNSISLTRRLLCILCWSSFPTAFITVLTGDDGNCDLTNLF